MGTTTAVRRGSNNIFVSVPSPFTDVLSSQTLLLLLVILSAHHLLEGDDVQRRTAPTHEFIDVAVSNRTRAKVSK